MIMEWIRFGLCAFFVIVSLICFISAVFGTYQFGFIMNRIHSAGIGDTMGLASIALAVLIANGLTMTDLKLVLLMLFMWCTSPVSSHFLGQIEYYTNPRLYEHTEKGDASWK
jgi:multicomponent Na+:H+ antiporter subunit G